MLITYSPLDAFEAMSEGAALMHNDGLSASLHTCAHHCRLLIVSWCMFGSPHVRAGFGGTR